MKNIILFLPVVIINLFLLSCKKETVIETHDEVISKHVTVTDDDSVVRTFQYNPNGLLTSMTDLSYYSGSPTSPSLLNIYRDASGRIQRFVYNEVPGFYDSTFVHYIPGTDNISHTITHSYFGDNDSTKFYYTGDRINREVAYRENSGTYSLNWITNFQYDVSGNIVSYMDSIESGMGWEKYTITFSFDANPSGWKLTNAESVLFFDFLLNVNKNNIKQLAFTDNFGSSVYNSNYVYNSNGYPVSNTITVSPGGEVIREYFTYK